MNETYVLSLSQLPSQPPIQVQLKGSPASFRVNRFRPYIMTDPQITQTTADREIASPTQLNADTRLKVELRRVDSGVVANRVMVMG